ncbi:MAG: AMIN domain-containing protein [Cyanobacteria bacterium CRU_2_1]|nr:AMIN domain-containing protein [Cyanobacteria bacterium RU_5_0]NJR57554.1 AMIN domain-containing protein [Cyanobacteria bacterium CRU_2_1]
MRNPPVKRISWMQITGLRLGIASCTIASVPWIGVTSLTGTAIVTLTTMVSAQAAILSRWDYNPTSGELEITVPGGTTPRYFLAAEPARIIVDLPNTDIGTVPTQQTYAGVVREIRVAQFQPGLTRIVLELSPDAVLAPEQVELRQVGTSDTEGDRWVLRPLLAEASTPVATPDPVQPDAIANSPTLTNPAPGETPPTTDVPPDSDFTNLPPLEPGATEIPVTLPPSDPVTAPTPTPQSIAESDAPTDEPVAEALVPEALVPEVPIPEAEIAPDNVAPEVAPVAIADPDPIADAIEPEPEPEPEASDRNSDLADVTADEIAPEVATAPSLPSSTPESPTSTLPPAAFSGDRPPTVSVPPLDGATSVTPQSTPVTPIAEGSPTPSTPEPVASPSPTPTITADAPIPETPSPETSSPENPIDFGQPLPESAFSNLPTITSGITSLPPNIAVAPSTEDNSATVLLPSGTILNLRYPGEKPLELSDEHPRQEVLVLAEAVHDSDGNVIFPEGSLVIGRFETGDEGSLFIAQAISLAGQNVLVNAQSENLAGRQEGESLLRNSALGIVAGALLGGLTGIGLIPVIAAGAAGAATTLVTSPDEVAVIQPDQVVEVRLIEDLALLN